jgi:transcription termination factor NusB
MEESKIKIMPRTEERETLVQALYSCLMNEMAHVDYDPKEVLVGAFGEATRFGITSPDQLSLFVKEVFLMALKNRDEIVALVSKYLKKWTFSRLNTYAQALFLEAVAEGKYTNYSAKPIVINSCVDLAKKYLSPSDSAYVNAVLDKVL